MSESEDISLWINQLAERPETSMDAIWQKYYEKLVRYARRKLRDMPRRQLDEEDVATDALHSLFRGVQGGRFPDLNDRDDLWKLLLTITARKAAKAIRNNLAQKRGGGDVRGESVFINANDASQDLGIENIPAGDNSPELGDEVVKQCEDLLSKLDEPVLSQIAVFKLEGFTNEEIAEKLDCAVRTVERKLSRIRDAWRDS